MTHLNAVSLSQFVHGSFNQVLLWAGRLQNVKSELLVRAENTITTPILPPSQALQTFLLSDDWFLLALISVISSYFLKRRSSFSFLIKKRKTRNLNWLSFYWCPPRSLITNCWEWCSLAKKACRLHCSIFLQLKQPLWEGEDRLRRLRM